MKRFRVAVVTGTRAEFGIWRPVLQAIGRSKRLELKLIVTGMHLLKQFGNTVRDVEAEFTVDAKAAMYRQGELPEKCLARGIGTLGAAYRKTGADLVMVLGDRLEMLAAASAALACRLPIAHVHGGETAPGIWDEQIRHAITKMAHVHFCSTKTAAGRIVQMGEEPARVHQVGAPALDLITGNWQGTSESAESARRLKGNEMTTVLLHPSGGTDEEECDRAHEMLSAMRNAHLLVYFAIGPNNDPGHKGILRAYKEAGVSFKMNVSQQEFWRLMAFSKMLIGNSSSGIIEAASLGLPVINIGDRQTGRERNANVLDVPWDRAAIEGAIHKNTTDQGFLKRVRQRKNIYGDGHASERIAAVLEGIARDGISTVKRFCD